MGLLSGIKTNVLVLGFVSFLTDVSSEMIFPLLPVFLTSILGVGSAVVGLIEGVADSASSLFDIFAGYASDRSGKRKEFVLAGYGLSSFTKLGIALANSWPLFLVFRGIERIGKSIRTSPRDAIIAASTPKGVRGKAFGLHRAMDTLGAIVGPVLAYIILSLLGNTEAGYRGVFYAALIPAFLAVAIIWLFVREPRTTRAKASSGGKPPFWETLRHLPAHYKRYLGASALFSLAYFSFALLIVQAVKAGISAQDILLVYTIYNLAYAAFSVPLGQLSDKVGRKPVIISSFILYGLVLLGFSQASQLWQFAALFAIYGVFVAADESVNKAYISDLVKDRERGLALGAYYTTVGAVYLPASILFGIAMETLGTVPAFGAAAIVAFGAALLLAVWARK